MSVREILRMGDPRLLRVAEPVRTFDTPELYALLQDLRDTMAANGAGLAAPQIGVSLQGVIFGGTRFISSKNSRLRLVTNSNPVWARLICPMT
jgi:peptide deformylase